MKKQTTIRLERVRFMPTTLEPGVLYVSEEFGSALHLCACGCGTKISTPLGPAEWTCDEADSGPSLHPSVGNWQHECRSHYWIHDGRIIWSIDCTPQQIAAGRQAEGERRLAHYDSIEPERVGLVRRIWLWLTARFKK